jgi:hypothetical protein
MNFEDKMKMRNSYLMDTYAKHNSANPSKWMSLGFAAFCIYMEQAHQKVIIVEDYCNDSLFKASVENWINAIKDKGMKNILTA